MWCNSVVLTETPISVIHKHISHTDPQAIAAMIRLCFTLKCQRRFFPAWKNTERSSGCSSSFTNLITYLLNETKIRTVVLLIESRLTFHFDRHLWYMLIIEKDVFSLKHFLELLCTLLIRSMPFYLFIYYLYTILNKIQFKKENK